jgi:hypothetical protein
LHKGGKDKTMNGLAQTIRRLEQLEEQMGVREDEEKLTIVIVGIAPDGSETSWQTLTIEVTKGKGKQT